MPSASGLMVSSAQLNEGGFSPRHSREIVLDSANSRMNTIRNEIHAGFLRMVLKIV